MRFRDRFYRFMQGRYGVDQLNKFLMWGSIILLILSRLIGFAPLYFVALIALVYCYFRMFSKNIYKRSSENNRYLHIRECIGRFFRRIFCTSRAGFRDTGSGCYTPGYKIFKCPNCKQKLRVPRKRGMIEISCRRCGFVFRKRT